MQTTQPSAPASIAIVRAIPQPGHKRRWCGLERWVEDRAHRPNPEQKHGLPWPDFEVKVAVVDDPKPFDPSANGGVPTEISPATFAMLERDERIAVKMLYGKGGDSEEAVRAKATAAKLDLQLVEARKELSDLSERSRLAQEAAVEQAEQQGSKIAALEAELAAARAQLQAQGKKK